MAQQDPLGALPSDPRVHPDPVRRLERWEQFGACWHVTSRHGDAVTVALCRCDEGEEVDRVTTDDPVLLDWLAGRTSSTDAQTSTERRPAAPATA